MIMGKSAADIIIIMELGGTIQIRVTSFWFPVKTEATTEIEFETDCQTFGQSNGRLVVKI